MPTDDSLSKQQDDLKIVADTLSRKILHLRKRLAVEAGTGVLFQLEEDLKEAEEERDKLEVRIEDLGVSRVYNAMLNIDHFDHEICFRSSTAEKRIAAFLIYGLPYYGHLWLLKRLLDLDPRPTKPRVIYFDFLNAHIRGEAAAMWSELGSGLGLLRLGTSPDKITERLRMQLETRSVMLVFKNVGATSEAKLQELLTDFWGPLAKAAQEALVPESESTLLMFLVDNSGLVRKWNLPFEEAPTPAEATHHLVCLPPLGHFSSKELEPWLKQWSRFFPLELIKNLNGTVQDILQQSDNGIPEKVAIKICALCQCPYIGEDTWLRL